MKENKMTLPGNPRGMRGFFAWLDATQPAVARAARARIAAPAMLGDLGITSPVEVTTTQNATAPSTADKIKDIVLAASQAYLTVEQMKAQRKVMDMQLQRAQAGLAPLDINMESYGLTGPSVSVGISPATKNLLIYGGLGLAGVYLFGKFLKR